MLCKNLIFIYLFIYLFSFPTGCSEFRRAVVVCLVRADPMEAINYMYSKFLTCGYSKEELEGAKTIAIGLNRDQILVLTTTDQPHETNLMDAHTNWPSYEDIDFHFSLYCRPLLVNLPPPRKSTQGA